MVYCGVLSKGCQRCRKRKVKCDEGRPGCIRCEKSNTPCPGYRNLNEVIFRDQSKRLARAARQTEQPRPAIPYEDLKTSSWSSENGESSSRMRSPISTQSSVSISSTLSQPINELAANFFFVKYSFKEPPYSTEYQDWLTRSYLDEGPNDVLRAALEAVGMAGIANVSHTSRIASKSRRRYCEALGAMQHALNDPVQAIADTTFLAVILLGLFETVTSETLTQYRSWELHVNAATALLRLRGPEQFNHERGAQLYIQIRAQILLACVQQRTPVPPALVEITNNYYTSGPTTRRRQRSIASPASICELTYRLVNLRAAFKTRQISDPRLICETALKIDSDLEALLADVPSNGGYTTVDATDFPIGTFFEGKQHTYPNLWIAEVWNNWRTLRILVNQIILQSKLRTGLSDIAQKSLEVIQQLSVDMCVSMASFVGSPRILALIRPLYVVSIEERNSRSVRLFAAEQLRHIDSSMGIRQAGLLAETVARRIDKSSGGFVDDPPNLTAPRFNN